MLSKLQKELINMHLFSSKTILELYKTCNVNGEMVKRVKDTILVFKAPQHT